MFFPGDRVVQCSVALRGEKDEGEEMEVVVSKVEVKVAKKVNREDNTMVRLHREGSGEERSGRRRRKGKRRKSENIFWIPFRKNGVQDKEMEAEAGVGDEEAEVEGWRRWWSQDRWQGGHRSLVEPLSIEMPVSLPLTMSSSSSSVSSWQIYNLPVLFLIVRNSCGHLMS